MPPKTTVRNSINGRHHCSICFAEAFKPHHPSIPITILCSAAETVIAAVPSITCHRLPAAPLPPNLTKDPIELFFEIPRLNNPNLRHTLQQISQKSRIKASIIDFPLFWEKGFVLRLAIDGSGGGIDFYGAKSVGKIGFFGADEPDLGKLLPKGFLERTKERGFVIKSWAPQAEVLRHDAVAGFVIHCGRSSVMEAVASGVPLIGWPLYAEQRMSRVFMVEQMMSRVFPG